VDRVGYILDGEPQHATAAERSDRNGVEGGNFFVDFTSDMAPRPCPSPSAL